MNAEEAQRRYNALRGREWRYDSFGGVLWALDTYLTRELWRRLHRENQKRAGKRVRANTPMPAWVGPNFTYLTVIVAGMGSAGIDLMRYGGFIEVLSRLDLRWIVDDLVFKDSTVRFAQYLEASAGTPETEHLLKNIEESAKKYPPRELPEMRAFFAGTRGFFHREGLGEPTARDIALLAAACSIEPINENLNVARKRLDERLGRWREQMDLRSPAWRDAVLARDAPGLGSPTSG